MKKSIIISGLAACALLFASCSNASSDSGSSVPANYDAPFTEVLSSSAEFAKKSIKACVPSRSSRAAVTPSAEDKWEGRIQNSYGNNWNVPSYYYGLNPGDSLEINGENLGTLQNLYHETDEYGNYRKASFVYKDQVYYVFDKADYVPNDSYVVLATEDNVNSIIFDQKGKTNSPEFSNFKFWVWERDLANDLYKYGNLGYAYTLRNVLMQDGSYATVTVSGYNYYHYGFRVWIKETDGHAVKKNYPNTTPYTFTSAYTVKTMSEVSSGEDFVYEIVNNTSGTLKVQNYMRDYSGWDSDHNIVALSAEVTLQAGETNSFNYKLSDLKALCPFGDGNVYMGCYFFPEGKWQCWGWENNMNQSGYKHTVIVTPSDNSCMNGENEWNSL